MQTSAGFWARVGFELGAEVDKKEAKMAVLRSVGDLKGEVDSWSHSLTGPDGSPAARPEGGAGLIGEQSACCLQSRLKWKSGVSPGGASTFQPAKMILEFCLNQPTPKT